MTSRHDQDETEPDDPLAAQPALQAFAVDGELAAEQAAVDLAYERLESMRRSAIDVVRHHRALGEVRSSQSRIEWESLLALTDQRLQHLEIGGTSLCFGRVDRASGESYQIGRLSILDQQGDPLVVDWRAPAAEAFYRATGRNPMDLVRRRHLLTRGRTVVGLDDEVFDVTRADESKLEIVGEGALLAALERSRTGRMSDIVATIQAEQDYVIRAPFPGILIVQGGPGTGKTAVALHRAAYLIYSNRQRLEDAGVLVVGPNRTFLRYIEQVLPSLGESGVELLTVDTLYGRSAATAQDSPLGEATKGDARMVQVIARAVRDRQRAPKGDLVVPYGSQRLRVLQDDLARMVEQTQLRRGTHNERRAVLVRKLRRALWASYRRGLERRLERITPIDFQHDTEELGFELDASETAQATMAQEQEKFLASIGQVPEVRAALERMWPLLTPEEFLHDLFGAAGLLRLACRNILRDSQRDSLYRPRAGRAGATRWTSADLALLDEAATLLGPLPLRSRRRRTQIAESARWMIEETIEDIALQTGELDAEMRRQLVNRLTDREEALLSEDTDDGLPRTYGHIIVDEAQDISPMQWRMISRRNPGGSMTIVGDLGQASRIGAIDSWDAALKQLPARREPRQFELTVNYRTPVEMMEVAAAVLAVSDPTLRPPTSVRHGGSAPRFTAVTNAGRLAAETARQVVGLRRELVDGKVAIIAPLELLAAVHGALRDFDIADLSPLGGRNPLDSMVAVFSPTDAKGLEFDAVVLVEPALLAGTTTAGLRGLYVALTRATRVLAVVHHAALPQALTPFATTGQ